MGKVSKVATKNSGSHSGVLSKKRRKTHIHISIDEEMSAVIDELALNKSKFINRVLRALLLGEGGDGMFIKFWWSRGPDLNRGPADLQSAATPRLGYRGTLQPSPQSLLILM